MNIKQNYSTYDLTLAATLLSLNFQLVSVDRLSSPTKVSFTFNKTIKLTDTLPLYLSKQIKIEPQTFFNNLKILKNIIYSKE